MNVKRILFILIALLLIIPGAVHADSLLPPGVPPPPSLPLMIEGTAPEGIVTVEINDAVYEVISDGKFYIPISGKKGDIITFTMGDIVVTEIYIDPMKSPFLAVNLSVPEATPEPAVKATIYDTDDDEPKAPIPEPAFSEEDLAWIYAHGGYLF